jgi:uncharacterized protein (UPF0276 family)
MGGLPCAKVIIDNRNALVQQMDCMVASIHLNSSRVQPTYEMQDKFLAATAKVAKIAAEIEKYVREGGEDYDSKPDPSARQ